MHRKYGDAAGFQRLQEVQRLSGMQRICEEAAESQQRQKMQRQSAKTIAHPPKMTYSQKRRMRGKAKCMKATSRVIQTTELLEANLLQLPLKDLLFAQRLSRHVKAVIDNSVEIKQPLFLSPKPIKADQAAFKPLINPLLSTCLASSKFLLVIGDEGSDGLSLINFLFVRAIDDFVKPPKNGTFTGEGHGHEYKAILELRTTSLLDIKTSAKIAAVGWRASPQKLHLNGSWRRMYHTQPPCTTRICADGMFQAFRLQQTDIPLGQMFNLRWPVAAMSVSWRRLEELLGEREAAAALANLKLDTQDAQKLAKCAARWTQLAEDIKFGKATPEASGRDQIAECKICALEKQDLLALL